MDCEHPNHTIHANVEKQTEPGADGKPAVVLGYTVRIRLVCAKCGARAIFQPRCGTISSDGEELGNKFTHTDTETSSPASQLILPPGPLPPVLRTR